jgi:hypothetical protein
MTVSNTESGTPLQRSVELLEQRVQALEERLAPKPVAAAAPVDLPNLMADVFRVTEELFPGEVSARVMSDPEYPQERFTVIEAQASGSPEEVVDRRVEWHRRVSRLSPYCSTWCLTLDYQE